MERLMDQEKRPERAVTQANDNLPQPELLPSAYPTDPAQTLQLAQMLFGHEEKADKQTLQDILMRKLFERERVMWGIAAVLVSLTVLVLAVRHAVD